MLMWICSCFCLIVFLGTETENQAVMFPIRIGFGKAFSVDESLEAFVLTEGRGYEAGVQGPVSWSFGLGGACYFTRTTALQSEQLPDLDKKINPI